MARLSRLAQARSMRITAAPAAAAAGRAAGEIAPGSTFSLACIAFRGVRAQGIAAWQRMGRMLAPIQQRIAGNHNVASAARSKRSTGTPRASRACLSGT